MNYAIQLLQAALDEELRSAATAKEMTHGNGFHFDNATMKAFDESRALAQKRIPELQEALEKINGKK